MGQLEATAPPCSEPEFAQFIDHVRIELLADLGSQILQDRVAVTLTREPSACEQVDREGKITGGDLVAVPGVGSVT
jgi:hypothetical protein